MKLSLSRRDFLFGRALQRYSAAEPASAPIWVAGDRNSPEPLHGPTGAPHPLDLTLTPFSWAPEHPDKNELES